MNHVMCGEIKPRMQFGPATGPDIKCTKKLGHAWNHRCETLPGQPSWPQRVMMSTDDMTKMLDMIKADPTQFKLRCTVVHCRCKELDP